MAQVCNDLGTVSKLYAQATALQRSQENQQANPADQGTNVPLVSSPTSTPEGNKGINLDVYA